MSSLITRGNAAGTGSVTLESPNTNSDFTITVPANTGTIITTGSSGQSIPRAALPAGSVLQVVQSLYDTLVTTTSGSYVTTGLSASITPTSATSRILIMCNTHASNSNASSSAIFSIFRGTVAGTNLGSGEGFGSVYSSTGSARGIISINYLDSPATTSSQTYTLGFLAGSAGNTQSAQLNNTRAVMILMEIAA